MMAEFNPDDTIGVYRIIRLLGKGAMGAVYEVVHTQLGVHYALKSFTLKDGHIDILKEKFLAEGRVLARLHHPNVVRVFDLNFDEATQTPYFVMDLVVYKDGSPHTLADVEVSDLDEEFVFQWFTELASALDYIHAQGIVHRDIKLNNILLSADKHVILSDFGVLRLFSDRLRNEVRASTTMAAEVTNSRLVMGTRGYMAPEVERGEEATPAADVYSLAVMIVYLLTGAWYEPGSRVLELLETLRLPWTKVLPQMLAEDPAERPVDLCALVKRLEVPASEVKTIVRPSGRALPKLWDGVKRALRKLPWKATAIFGGAFAATAAVFTSVWFALRKPAAPQSAEEEFAATFGVEAIESGGTNEVAEAQSQRRTAGNLYCVVDLSTGPNATNYPVSYLAAEPKGGWTDEYKTTKLVLRRIEPGTFIMGKNQKNESRRVTLTKPFYIGVFEVTQKQYRLVTGGNPSKFKGDMRPVERVSYDMIRGKGEGAKWPVSNAVDAYSFMGKLRARTGLEFDLPTSAQWEFACRAGTTTIYSYGDSANGDYMWYKDNSSSKTHPVGLKRANPWGLYDMHGNVWDFCLDWASRTLNVMTDPRGAFFGKKRKIRGGAFTDMASAATAAVIYEWHPSVKNFNIGFRLCCSTESHERGAKKGANDEKQTVVTHGSAIGKVQLWEGGPYWAEMNIGAKKPEDSGYYFWWGDTVGYKRENDAWVASDASSSNFSFDSKSAHTFWKTQQLLQNEGWTTVDGILTPQHDAAHVQWGGGWRMPANQEIIDLSGKCEWTQTMLNGVKGYLVRGKGDYVSASIFLPVTGRVKGRSPNVGYDGCYWSSFSAPDKKNSKSRFAASLNFWPKGHGRFASHRYEGFTVRPVQGGAK